MVYSGKFVMRLESVHVRVLKSVGSFFSCYLIVRGSTVIISFFNYSVYATDVFFRRLFYMFRPQHLLENIMYYATGCLSD